MENRRFCKRRQELAEEGDEREEGQRDKPLDLAQARQPCGSPWYLRQLMCSLA